MTSYAFTGNLIPKLSIYSTQLRLLPLQWMRRNVVRCLSQKSSSGLPVRYVSKKRREANQTSDINLVDIPLKDGVPSSSEGTKSFQVISNKGKLSSAESNLTNSLSNSRYVLNEPELNRRERYREEITVNEHMKVHEKAVDSRKAAEVVVQESLTYNWGERSELSNAESKVSNALLNSRHDLNHRERYREEITVKEHMKIREKAVDCRKAAEVVVQESLTSNRGEWGELSNAECKVSNALLNFRHDLNHRERYREEITAKENMKVHQQAIDCRKAVEVVAQESVTCNRGGTSEGFKLNEELSNDGIVDEEYLEAPEEVVEEAQLNNGNAKGRLDEIKKGAEKLAVELLARRAYTAVELQKKLSLKQFPLNIIEAVLRDFRNRGLINDGLYAETFSHSRWKSSSWGPRRIKQALTVKGVSENNVKKAVKLVFEDSEEGDQSSSIKLSSSSLQELYIRASKQWKRSQNAPHDTRKSRLIRWLQYRGFDWGVVGTIMKKIEVENPR